MYMEKYSLGNHTYSYYDGRAMYVVIIIEDHLSQLQDIKGNQFKLVWQYRVIILIRLL